MKDTTKLDRLNTIRTVLLECMIDSAKDADEWQIYYDMSKHINYLMVEEYHRLGYMAVYSIVDGNASDELFHGSKESCDIYVDILLEGHPELKGNIIIANI